METKNSSPLHITALYNLTATFILLFNASEVTHKNHFLDSIFSELRLP